MGPSFLPSARQRASVQGAPCRLVMFGTFLENIMRGTHHDHHISISRSGRSTWILRFAHVTHLMAGSNGNRFETVCTHKEWRPALTKQSHG